MGEKQARRRRRFTKKLPFESFVVGLENNYEKRLFVGQSLLHLLLADKVFKGKISCLLQRQKPTTTPGLINGLS